jgi:hypothetical protein
MASTAAPSSRRPQAAAFGSIPLVPSLRDPAVHLLQRRTGTKWLMTGRLSALPEEISPTIGFVGTSGVLTLYTKGLAAERYSPLCSLEPVHIPEYSQLRDR